jgi:methyl-accepting chemotaxis protein
MMPIHLARVREQLRFFKELAKALENISEMSQSISASAEEKTTNARQMSHAIEGINEITQSSASEAQGMSFSTDSITAMAQELQRGGRLSSLESVRRVKGRRAGPSSQRG